MKVRCEKDATHLGNWREPPYNRRAFSHMRELVPTANIAAGVKATPLPRQPIDLLSRSFAIRGGSEIALDAFLDETYTDALLVLRDGKVATEWWRNEDAKKNPHIVFSVSKSITAMLAGILKGKGLLDPDGPVMRYVPEARESAYGDASVRHLLDMTISLDFVESYLDPESIFALYRESTGWNPPRPGLEHYLHGFLLTLKKASREHGERFAYNSPNSDMLGWVCERAGGAPFADLLSDLVWRPMGAADDAYITVDPRGAPRTAGGICARPEDLARFGEMIRNDGKALGRQVVPADWIADMRSNGDPLPWSKGDMAAFLPNGNYRSKWYIIGNKGRAFTANGIHGQWLYVDPKARMVIAKLSSQPLPVDQPMDFLHLDVFDGIARALEKS